MANIKVVDINEADVKLANSSHELCDKQEEASAIEDTKEIEEAKPEEILNEVVEQTNEEANEETASGSLNSNKVGVETKDEEQPKPKAKLKPSDRVDCNTCGKNLSYKNYRYRHEKLCTAEPKPVKAQAKPKAKVKMMPQPKFKQVEAYEIEEPKPIKKQTPQQQSQPTNPLVDITNHYQLLQNQYIQQKKEKYNNLCQNMFAPKSKKR